MRGRVRNSSTNKDIECIAPKTPDRVRARSAPPASLQIKLQYTKRPSREPDRRERMQGYVSDVPSGSPGSVTVSSTTVSP